jgi:hypothetical protein
MSEDTKVLWACARCAKRKNLEGVNPDPVVLMVCSYCSIENWCRPVGHAGKGASGRLMPEPKNPELTGLPVYEKKEDIKVGEAKITLHEPETVEEEAPEPEVDPKEAEIAALKAKLAELEQDE